MPKELEDRLKRQARAKFKGVKNSKERQEKIDAYVYGTMRNTGWRPKREKHG